MCRLMGMVSGTPAPLSDKLSDLLDSFTRLSCEHADGWGIATWRHGELGVINDIAPAHDSPLYPAALADTTDAAILHLRLATPGIPLELSNTHPFRLGALAFAHNGCFSPINALDDLIDPELLAETAGTTDSERYFLRVVSLLRTKDPIDALETAAADIRERAEFASLNCLLLTEDALYAYSDEDPESDASKRRGPEFFRLRYQVRADRVAVVSTGIAGPHDMSWIVLPYRHVLEIRRSDLRVSTHAVSPARTLS
jgi:predicted glutamine amidotransferase